MAQTIKTILQEMSDIVKNGDIKSPAWWLDRAMDLCALWQELKDEMNKYKIAYTLEIVNLIEQGKKKGEAELKTQSQSENYKKYLYLEGRDKLIKEFVMLAKKRSTVENEYN